MITPGEASRRFLFPAEDDRWLALLRVGLGISLISYCTSLYAKWFYFLASDREALLSRQLSEGVVGVQSSLIPSVGWLIALAADAGVGEHATLRALWLALLFAGVLLTAGLLTRTAAITAWFLQLCAASSMTLFAYGVDGLLTTGLFYLMLSPLPDCYSVDRHLWQHRAQRSEISGFFRRVLQLHLCFIYVVGGITKSVGAGWWNGAALSRALMRPPFDVLPAEVLIRARPALSLLGIAICVLEVGYPLLIWGKRTRRSWLALTCLMHAGIGLTMGMYLFSLVMIVLNVAAFGPQRRQTAGSIRSEKLIPAGSHIS